MPQAFVQFVRESIGSKKVAGLLLVVILCTNLTLCLFRLDHQSFNRDEGFSVYMGQVPIASFLRIVWDRELNMVAYYALLRGWSRISDSEIFVRLLSVSFAVGTVALIAALGGKLFDKRTGLLAAFLLAIHASAVVYAQNARAYTMAAFLVTLSWLLLIRLLERWSWWLLTAYVGTAAVAVYSQFFAVLVIVAQLLWVGLVARQPFPGRKVIVCGVALGGLLVPFGVFLLTRNVGQLEWVSALTWGQAGALLALLGGGAASVMYLLCWIAAAGKLIQGRSNSRETPNLLVLLCWLIVPVALTIVYSFHTYVLEPRFLFVCVPGAVLLAAAGLSRYSRKYAGALLGIAVLGSGYSLFEHYIDPAEDWRHAIQYVAQQAVAGDQFVIWPSQADAVFEYYWRKSEHSRQITCTEEPTRAWRELSPDRLWLVALCTGSCTVAQQVFRWAIAKGEYSPVTTLTFPWIRVWLETRKEGSVHASEQGDTGTIAHFPETLLNTVTVCHARQLSSQ